MGIEFMEPLKPIPIHLETSLYVRKIVSVDDEAGLTHVYVKDWDIKVTDKPLYVGTVLSELGEDVREIRVRDSDDSSSHIYRGNWQAHIPVYILNKEVKECTMYEDKGIRVLNIRV